MLEENKVTDLGAGRRDLRGRVMIVMIVTTVMVVTIVRIVVTVTIPTLLITLIINDESLSEPQVDEAYYY